MHWTNTGNHARLACACLLLITKINRWQKNCLIRTETYQVNGNDMDSLMKCACSFLSTDVSDQIFSQDDRGRTLVRKQQVMFKVAPQQDIVFGQRCKNLAGGPFKAAGVQY